jgi:hypothetical protein
MSERRHHHDTRRVAVDETASARTEYAEALAQTTEVEQHLRELRAISPFTRSDAQDDAITRLSRRLEEMQELLPSLEAAARQERASIDVEALEDAWTPLMVAKQQAYGELSQLITAVWQKAVELEGLHGQQEALLQGIEDPQVRQYMLSTFWIDAGTMRMRMAGNLYPPAAWHDFFQNSVGFQGRSGAQIGQNDPGTTEIPPMLIDNVQTGQLFAERLHRG